MMTKLKSVTLFLSLFYLTVYLPVMVVAYSPYWYQGHCHFSARCSAISEEKTDQGIAELVSFFRHTARELASPFWTVKEINHLTEVRGRFDVLTLLCVPFLMLFFYSFDLDRIRRYSLANMIMVLSPLAVLPFFKYFWRNIFHPLLFSNRNWLNTPLDFSYYIMPRVFFQYTVALVVLSAFLLNLAVFTAAFLKMKAMGKGENMAPDVINIAG